MKRTRYAGILLSLAMLLSMASGCGGGAGSPSAAPPASAPAEDPAPSTAPPAPAQELVTVRFGLLPYQDWMPWMLADKLGYFAEAGIKLEVTTFTDDVTCAEALASGDIDVACGNSGSGPLVLSRFPNLRIISPTCGFLGYAIMVRPGDVSENGGSVKTYATLYQEELDKGVGEAEASANAVRAACAQLEGKEIVMDRGTGSNLPLSAALEAAGLSTDEVNFIDISDVEGALAFWDGTGDFELGGFPQVTSLSELGAYKLVSGAELGGKAVVLSVEMATEAYIQENMDTILKLRQVWYRVIDDLYSADESYMEQLAEVTSSYTGTAYTAQDMRRIATEIDPWPTAEEAPGIFFAADGAWSIAEIYGGSLDYWVNISGQVPEGWVELDVQMAAATGIMDQVE